MSVRALVDTGAVSLCVPEHVALQPELDELERREVTTADGKSALVPYVGPIQVRFGNRSCFVGASCWAATSCSARPRFRIWT